ACRRRDRSFSRWRRAPRPRLPPAGASRCRAYQGARVMVMRHLPPELACDVRRPDRIPLDGRNPAVYPAAALRGSPPDRIGVASEGRRDSQSDAASMTTIEAPKGAARPNTMGRAAALVLAALLAPQAARAQDKGTLNPQPLPPLAKPDDPATPAKELFGRKTAPAHLQARTIGFYSKGCLAGAVALPINGATWQ